MASGPAVFQQAPDIVRNLGDTTTRTYSIQPIGWEVSG